MVTDQLLNAGASVLSSVSSALPEWNTGMDGEQLRQILMLLAGWDNWLPLHELVTCLGIAAAVWGGGHAANVLRQGVKAILDVIP